MAVLVKSYSLGLVSPVDSCQLSHATSSALSYSINISRDFVSDGLYSLKAAAF
jgi:hypothetical protein